ncbi:nucleotide pyrophosphatase [Candidatus Fermentibacteria bacterium]|nr:MAG: nucleotide pyrophosphatase [Candidatus Fermentibacteria bacterium]
MNRREFLKKAILAPAAVAALSAGCGTSAAASRKRVIVLGVDGMDPALLAGFAEQGLMPNVKRLMDSGSFRRLATSNPPQSPVAWSNFITGAPPPVHGIFDFIHRDPETMIPFLSTSEVAPPESTLDLGKFRLPLSGGGVNLLRRGTPFWNELLNAGIPVTMVKLPVDFPPPAENRNGLFLSGLGTPDVRGSQGSFTFFTDDPRSISDDTGGGVVIPVRDYGDGCYTCRADGPANSLVADSPTMSTEIKVWADRDSKAVRIDVNGSSIVLGEKQWSPWMGFSFTAIPGVSTVNAMGRFYLKQVYPNLKLYLTPLNIDPENPALPISSPDWYSRDLAKEAGKFYTQGFPEDTKALSRGIFDDDDYVSQAHLVLEERMRLFHTALSRYREGMLFFYFTSLDLNVHMFFRSMDPASPLYGQVEPRFHGVIANLYSRIDMAVGEAMELLDDRTELILLSDHGFAPFRRSFNLNSFLAAEGFATIATEHNRNSDMYACLDWSATGAYGLGLNGLYVNQQGREKNGAVPPADRRKVMEDLKAALEAAVDPLTGEHPVKNLFILEDMYPGMELPPWAPDMLVGYNLGYRASWETTLGSFPEDVITDNLDPWSGTHCISPDICPGSLVTTVKDVGPSPSLTDMGQFIKAILLEDGVIT